MREDDNNWPEPDRVGRQELEIVMGNEHISFTTSKIGSLVDVQSSADPEGLRIFYYLVQVKLWFWVLIDLCKGLNCACSIWWIIICRPWKDMEICSRNFLTQMARSLGIWFTFSVKKHEYWNFQAFFFLVHTCIHDLIRWTTRVKQLVDDSTLNPN